MNQRITLLLITLGLSFFSKAQVSDATDLDINNVRARFNSNGSLFWDLNSTPRFEVPKITNQTSIRKHPIFMASVWFSAIDSLGDTLVAAQMYGQNGTDFHEGYLIPDSDTGIAPSGYRIYKYNRTDLENGIDDSNAVTDDVLEWPAQLEYQGKSYTLSPFNDLNGNGIYDPLQGESPESPGNPDQRLFFAYHDQVEHEIGKTAPLGIQIFVDGFAWTTNDALNESIFVRYRVIPQKKKLTSFRMGLLADFDLGNYADDYIGTDTARNMIYVYNGDDDDEGILGYGLNPPAFGARFIDKNMCQSCFNQNTFSGPNRNPNQGIEYWNMLQGLTTSGDSMEASGFGIPTGTKTKFAYGGNAVDGIGWNMKNAGVQPSDYRMLGVTGQDTLIPGDTFQLIVQYVFGKPDQGGARGGLKKMIENADRMASDYVYFGLFGLEKRPTRTNACFVSRQSTLKPTGPGVSNDKRINATRFNVFPNPANNKLSISPAQPSELYRYQIQNALGQLITTDSGKGVTQMDLSPLSEGLYFLRILDENGTPLQVERVVVRH